MVDCKLIDEIGKITDENVLIKILEQTQNRLEVIRDKRSRLLRDEGILQPHEFPRVDISDLVKDHEYLVWSQDGKDFWTGTMIENDENSSFWYCRTYKDQRFLNMKGYNHPGKYPEDRSFRRSYAVIYDIES